MVDLTPLYLARTNGTLAFPADAGMYSRNSNTLAAYGRTTKNVGGSSRRVVKKVSTRGVSSRGFRRTSARKPYKHDKYLLSIGREI